MLNPEDKTTLGKMAELLRIIAERYQIDIPFYIAPCPNGGNATSGTRRQVILSVADVILAMDEKRFLNALRLRDEGKLSEACSELIHIVESSEDPLDKVGALLYTADVLEMSGQHEASSTKLSAARALIEGHPPPKPEADERFKALQLFLDFQEATLFWLRCEDPETALKKLEAALSKYTLPMKDPRARDFFEGLQIRRAFALADLGRCKEALPILEGIKSPQEYKAGIAFYLGHCYLEADDYERAEEKLTQAMKVGLSRHLEYQAHCELGKAYYNLRDYCKAKQELEMGAEKADADYIRRSHIWKWLEYTCRLLGLKAEADQYARLVNPS